MGEEEDIVLPARGHSRAELSRLHVAILLDRDFLPLLAPGAALSLALAPTIVVAPVPAIAVSSRPADVGPAQGLASAPTLGSIPGSSSTAGVNQVQAPPQFSVAIPATIPMPGIPLSNEYGRGYVESDSFGEFISDSSSVTVHEYFHAFENVHVKTNHSQNGSVVATFQDSSVMIQAATTDLFSGGNDYQPNVYGIKESKGSIARAFLSPPKYLSYARC